MRIATLFSGIGAPEAALKRLGISYELVYFGEIDKYAVKSYCAIHNEPESKNIGDITKVDIDSLPKDLDLIVGGSPCQDFSLAGKRKGGEADSKTRSSLMWNYVEIIRVTQPKAILWENVKGALSEKDYPNYKKFIAALVAEGYKISAFTLNGKLFGVPQNRERIFVLGSKTHTIQAPKGYDCGIRLQTIKESVITDKNIANYRGNKYLKSGKLDKAIARSMAQLDGDYSLCITSRCWASSNTQYITRQNENVTIISVKELAELFGFKHQDFINCLNAGVSYERLYRQAGNSIIVQVLMAIFGEYYNVPWKEKVYGERYKHGQSQYADLPIMMEENNGLF